MIAYRGWKIPGPREDAPFPILTSVSRSDEWLGPVFNADKVPIKQDYLGSGIYCTKFVPKPGTINYEYFTHGAYGEVELSGTVIEHDWGYRAEIATVRKIIVRDLYPYWPYRMLMSTEDFIKRLEDRYQCDVSIEFINLYPPLDPTTEEDNVFVGRVNWGQGPIILRVKVDRINQEREVEEFFTYNKVQAVVVSSGIRITLEGYQV
jgi:hypothetical protein